MCTVLLTMFQVRSLVISPQDDQRTWLKYASLCRNAGRLQLSHKTLVTILGKDPLDNLEVPLPTQHPQATFAFTKHLWDTGMKEKGLQHLQSFVHNRCDHFSFTSSFITICYHQLIRSGVKRHHSLIVA